jgi:ABC-type transport system substrate-binding protein
MRAGRRLRRVLFGGATVVALAVGCVETPTAPASAATSQAISGEPTLSQASPTPQSTLSSASPATPSPTPTPSPSTSAHPLGPTLATVLAGLTVAAERRTGYRRQLFRLWIDADGNGCNTREEVLIAEAVLPAKVSASCAITDGHWFSPYDGLTFTDASKLDIDHMVPLAEAWDSGAYAWTPALRKAYANDIGVSWALIAVSAASNRSKGDKDPAEWLPPSVGYRCQYVAIWVAIKARWDLAVDPAEKSAIAGETACQDTPVPGS